MIWIILIVAYLLLVAMALGFTLGLDDCAEHEMRTHIFLAFLGGWALAPFVVVFIMGVFIANKYNEN